MACHFESQFFLPTPVRFASLCHSINMLHDYLLNKKLQMPTSPLHCSIFLSLSPPPSDWAAFVPTSYVIFIHQHVEASKKKFSMTKSIWMLMVIGKIHHVLPRACCCCCFSDWFFSLNGEKSLRNHFFHVANPLVSWNHRLAFKFQPDNICFNLLRHHERYFPLH